MGTPKNLGDPDVSAEDPGGYPGDQNQALRRGPTAQGANGRADSGNRGAKETKRHGMHGRKSELFIVPRKRENQPEGSRGGKGEPVGGTVGGNDAEDTEP
jgi:hypothetical protein